MVRCRWQERWKKQRTGCYPDSLLSMISLHKLCFLVFIRE
jgi:hypothetical protein